MKLLATLSILTSLVLITGCASTSKAPVSLHNGKDLSGWHTDIPEADKNKDLKPSFIIREGMLVSLGSPQGHLITNEVHQNYRLVAEYRFPKKPGNCGILVHASTPRELYGMFPKSIEVQMNHQHAGDFWCIGENIEVPDMEKRRPRREGQAFGGGSKDARRILNLTDNSEKPLGEWNTMVIECQGAKVDVWVNGDHVNNGFNCTATKGQVAVQAEGAEVEFRRLEISPLPSK